MLPFEKWALINNTLIHYNRLNHEKDISAFEKKTKEQARVPCQDEHQKWTKSDQPQTSKRPGKVVRVKRIPFEESVVF